MEIPATDLAARISEAYSDTLQLSKKTVAQLATALHEGVGAARQDHHLFVVLAPPLESPEGKPVFIAGECHKNQLTLPPTNVNTVSRFFRERTKTKPRPEGCQLTWIPVSSSTVAILPFGGQIGNPVGTTKDPGKRGSKFTWYDLQDVPIGGIIYRLDSRGALYVFQRLNAKKWVRFTISKPSEAVDMPVILAKLQAEHGPISGLARDPGCADLSLLR